MTTAIVLIVSFLFVALASQHIGRYAARIKMPLITGYLLAGVVVGPFILRWISDEQIESLKVIDQISLGFIAFAAGSELYLKEVRSRLKSIGWITSGLVVSTFTFGTVVVYVIADHVPFMKEMSSSGRLSVALMAGAILVARSPSSAIAIIAELRARGPYTKTSLGVTVVMDAIVILVFATAASIASSLLGREDFEPSSILLVIVDLIISLVLGYPIGRLLQEIATSGFGEQIKTAVILAIGLGVFWLSDGLHDFSEHSMPWTIDVEPLLSCMIAGFVVANYGSSRELFSEALEKAGPFVFLAFFTLVGVSLDLNALVSLWPIALVLFGVRLTGIIIGSMSGAMIAREPPQHIRLAWMAYITQAGIGLGLAKTVSDGFPAFGDEFAAMIIAVIVLNQIVGPPFFKLAIKRVGESHLKAVATPDEIRDALILGIDDQSLAVARQLMAHDWNVIVAYTDKSHVKHLDEEDVDVRYIPVVDEESLSELISGATDALIAMLGSDEANYRACELVYERFGIPRVIVRLNDLGWSDKFDELGVLVVEPASAMINLLDQFVRVPRLAALLFHRDPEHDVVQITMSDPDIEGLPIRDLRLPSTVRLLGINREGHAIVPTGSTILRHNDEVTLVGEPHELHEVADRWGY